MDEFCYPADSVIFSRTHLVAELSLYKDLSELSKLGFPLNKFTRRESPSQFVFATASNDGYYFHTAMDAIAIIQALFPQHFVYFYDISDGVLNNKADKVNKRSVMRPLQLSFDDHLTA